VAGQSSRRRQEHRRDALIGHDSQRCRPTRRASRVVSVEAVTAGALASRRRCTPAHLPTHSRRRAAHLDHPVRAAYRDGG